MLRLKQGASFCFGSIWLHEYAVSACCWFTQVCLVSHCCANALYHANASLLKADPLLPMHKLMLLRIEPAPFLVLC